METIIIVLIIVFLAYEFLEHVLFPVFGLVAQKKKKAFCGPERLKGEVGEVKEWREKEGYVFINGELWKAISEVPLNPGDKVIMQKIEGLILKVCLLNSKKIMK